jgi:hypothetical protein
VAVDAHAFGRWLFSHEEDGARVYRPREGAFAPSRRPRDGFDIDRDGTLRSYKPGAGDAPVSTPGRWVETSDGRLQVTDEDGRRRLLEIVAAAKGTLTVRWGG